MRVSILYVLIFSGFLSSAQAGERLEFKVVNSGAAERITLYLQGSQARISSSANTRTAVIFDAKARQIHILDHADKSITTLDQASMEKMASMARGVGDFARSQGGVLGDLFKTFGMDSELGDTADVSVKKVKGSQKIAGVNCRVQQIYQQEKLQTRLCLAERINIAVAERKTLNQLLEFGQLMMREGQVIMSQFNLPIPLLPNAQLEGVPIYIENIPAKTRATLSGLKTLDIQAAQFALPAGYSKTLLSL